MNLFRLISLLPMLGMLLGMLSCGPQVGARYAEIKIAPPPATVEEMTGYFENADIGIPFYLVKWEDDASLKGELLIVVDKKKQMLYAYRGDVRIGYSPVSTGKNSSSTPTGIYRISEKQEEHESYYGHFVSADGTERECDSRYESPRSGEHFEPSVMPYFMRVVGAVGLHGGYLPGKPASHGCIRLPMPVAENLFKTLPSGTKVAIVDGEWKLEELQARAQRVETSPPLSRARG